MPAIPQPRDADWDGISQAVAADMARRVPSLAHERDEMYCDALVGCGTAAATFNGHGTLAGWATYKARHAIIDGLRARDPLSPRERARYRAELADPDCCNPTPCRTITSLDDQLHEPSDPRSQDAFRQVDDACQVASLLACLSPMERTVVEEYDLHGLTLADIGRRHGFAESWACQLRQRALRKMRRQAESDAA